MDHQRGAAAREAGARAGHDWYDPSEGTFWRRGLRMDGVRATLTRPPCIAPAKLCGRAVARPQPDGFMGSRRVRMRVSLITISAPAAKRQSASCAAT